MNIAGCSLERMEIDLGKYRIVISQIFMFNLFLVTFKIFYPTRQFSEIIVLMLSIIFFGRGIYVFIQLILKVEYD